MLKLNKFNNHSLENAQDIKQVLDILTDNNGSINIFSNFNDIDESLIKVIKIAKSSLKEYEMQLEMIETYHLKICKNLQIDLKELDIYFQNIKKTCDAIFEIGDSSKKASNKILYYSSLLSSKIIYEFLKKSNNNLTFEFIDIEKNIDFDKFNNKTTYILGGFNEKKYDITLICSKLNIKNYEIY